MCASEALRERERVLARVEDDDARELLRLFLALGARVGETGWPADLCARVRSRRPRRAVVMGLGMDTAASARQTARC